MGLFQIGMLKIFSQLPANLFLCSVMKSFVMLVMINIMHRLPNLLVDHSQSFRFRFTGTITRSRSFAVVSFKMVDSRLLNSATLRFSRCTKFDVTGILFFSLNFVLRHIFQTFLKSKQRI